MALENFSTMSFVQKVAALTEIEQGNHQEALQDILGLCDVPPEHPALKYMIECTLSALLANNEKAAVEGLLSGNPSVRLICIKIAANKKFKSAAPTLIQMTANIDDAGTLFEILSALSMIDPPEAIELFRQYMVHPNSSISSLSIDVLAKHRDSGAVEQLCQIVSDVEDCSKECDLIVGVAIMALGKIRNEAALTFLASKIHHKNPGARQIIHKELAKVGAEAVRYVRFWLAAGDTDQQIMAANVLGHIGGPEALDALVEAIKNGIDQTPNVKFAVYEAIGRIPSKKGQACLLNGLSVVTDDTTLMTMISSLDSQLSPIVVDRIKHLFRTDETHADRLARAIVSSEALEVFEVLYKEDDIGQMLIKEALRSKDEELIGKFTERLKHIGTDQANADASRLSSQEVGGGRIKRLLAIDDSRAMLHFYRAVAAELGMNVETAANGKLALDRLMEGEPFDVVVVDMNMPVMDGVQFTKAMRSSERIAQAPVIMVTTESESSQIQFAKTAGVTTFMTKPCCPEAIKAKIKTFLS